MSQLPVAAPELEQCIEHNQTALSTVYTYNDLPPSEIELWGRFASYSVLVGQPNEDRALILLRVISTILAPSMCDHNIKVRRLAEITVTNDPNARGFNQGPGTKDGQRVFDETTGMYDTDVIGIRLRDDNGFLPLEVILDSVAHELSHCWHMNHGTAFLQRWNGLMDEVENDLGGRLTLPRGAGEYAAQLEAAGSVEMGASRKPSRRGIAAMKMWKSMNASQ